MAPNDPVADQSNRATWLPEFCSPATAFSLLVLAAATLLVVQLAPGNTTGLATLERVPVAMLFVLAVSLLVIATLCALRPRLAALPTPHAVAGSYVVVLTGAALGSLLAYWLDHALGLEATIEAGQGSGFVGGIVAVVAIAWGIALRHFYVRGQWQQQVRAHARAQLDALQARIRPHFLFNSMNTIASLVRDRPDDAERAIEDLSELFRAALRAGATSTLADELALVRHYVGIEKLRLGTRLEVLESLGAAPLDLPIPALLVQPLVENAILHGIQKLESGGQVELSAERGASSVVISVRNPMAPRARDLHRGSGTALDNIRQRLRHHFGDEARLEVERGDDYHLVRLILPCA
jgi:two-component system sensor histidine kinase AlgZ